MKHDALPFYFSKMVFKKNEFSNTLSYIIFYDNEEQFERNNKSVNNT